MLDTILKFIETHPELFVTVLLALVQLVRERMKAKEAILLIMNALKDEAKLEGDNQFSEKTIEKIDKVAEYMNAGKEAVEHVKEVVNDVNRKKGIKIGSIKGKPIYLEDVAQAAPIGGALANSLKVIRGIFRR